MSSEKVSAFPGPPSSSTFPVKGSESGKAVYVENHGCAANRFDFEVMLALLARAGNRLTRRAGEADIIFMNTCGVKKPTEDRMIERLRFLRRLGKPIIIAGCLPRINSDAIIEAVPDYSAMLDPQSVDKVLLALKAAERSEKNRIFFSQKSPLKLDLPKMRLNRCVEIVPISEGCSGACAFCCVRFARGTLFSYPKEAIVRRVGEAVAEGAKEVWITSQDAGSYGLDTQTSLAEMLSECCKVEGKFLIRVGMMNPDQVLRMLPEMIDAYKDEKIFKFLHLPVQSGDNEVLRRMNRRYAVEEFKAIVDSFRKAMPEITLATDVICGFPGESEEAFGGTLRLIEEAHPDVVNISKFFPRLNTPAERMRQIPVDEVKNRSLKLTRLVREMFSKRNQRWLNWEGEILVDERGKGASWIGRNFAYRPIVVKSREDLLGKFMRVKVVKAYRTYLEAVLTG